MVTYPKDTLINLTFSLEELNNIMLAIGELPYKVATPLVTRIQEQVTLQLQGKEVEDQPQESVPAAD